MKDSEFIELLNLYLDHEISAADAVRLEAEVQSNPQRRRTYREYCSMQKACVVLAQQAQPSAEVEQHNVIDFEPSRSWGFGSVATGLCAAAACVALVFVARNRVDPTTNQNSPAMMAAQPQPVATGSLAQTDIVQPRAIARTVSTSPRTNELKPAFTAPAFVFAADGEPRGSEIVSTTDARFEWMNRVQVSPLTRVPAEELVFEAKYTQAPESRTFVSHRPIQGQIDRTAFQFQR